MSYKVEPSSTSPRGTHAKLDPPTPPKASDFDLRSISIEPADNGCIVECNYRMKPDVHKKLSGPKNEYVDHDIRNPSVKKVFSGEEAEEIKNALQGVLAGKKESEPASKGKTKVRKV